MLQCQKSDSECNFSDIYYAYILPMKTKLDAKNEGQLSSLPAIRIFSSFELKHFPSFVDF